MKLLIGKLYCLLGWHDFRWSLGSDPDWIKHKKIILDSPIPPHAKCSRCGVLRGK